MSVSQWIRQAHRWLAIAFILGFIVVSGLIVMGQGKEPPAWVYVVPLLPLGLLTITGLYLFVLPYAAAWRGERRVGAWEEQ
jgi:hypothetical protein